MNLAEFLDEIVQAIRGRVEGGRSHGEVAVELHLERSLVSRIVRGEHGGGPAVAAGGAGGESDTEAGKQRPG